MSTSPSPADEGLSKLNPFDSQVMHTAWELFAGKVPDVSDIHSSAERVCIEEMSRVCEEKGQRALFIEGEAGSGKTHLVGRLLRHCERGLLGVVGCYINFERISKVNIWSGVRRCLVDDLLRQPASGPTRLERLLGVWLPGAFGAPAEASPAHPAGLIGSLFWMLQSGGSGKADAPTKLRQRLAAELPRRVELPRGVRRVLPALFGEDEEQRQDARDWLLGEPLAAKSLEALGLPDEDLNDQQREAQSCEVVLALLRLSSDRLPIVLFYDQVEGYMAEPGDRSGYYRFGQYGIHVRQEARACLLHLTFARSDRRQDMREGMGEAAWARMVDRQVVLPPLKWEQATGLILGRMNHPPVLKKLRAEKIASGQGQFWPLSSERIQAVYNSPRQGHTPRSLLKACQGEFGKLTGSARTDPGLADFLMTQLVRRKGEVAGEPPQEACKELVAGALWLNQLVGLSWKKSGDPLIPIHLPNVALVLEGVGERTAFAACPKHPQVWRRFKQLTESWFTHIQTPNRCRHLIVVSDQPIEAYPPREKTRQVHLAGLLALNGVEFVCPRAENVRTFRALQRLLSDAAVGKVVLGGVTVEEAQVHDWARASVFAPAHPLGTLRELADDFRFPLQAQLVAQPVGAK